MNRPVRSYIERVCVKRSCHLFAAGDGAAAEVSAGFRVDHGGNVFLRHQISEELLAALRLLPDKHETKETL